MGRLSLLKISFNGRQWQCTYSYQQKMFSTKHQDAMYDLKVRQLYLGRVKNPSGRCGWQHWRTCPSNLLTHLTDQTLVTVSERSSSGEV